MNHKKLRRLTQPNMWLYFVVMAGFCIVALLMKQYSLALGEAAVTVLLLFSYRWFSVRRRRALTEYVRETNEMLGKSKNTDVPFPVALVQLNDDELFWYNRAFAQLTGVKETLSNQRISDVLPGFSCHWLAEGRTEAEEPLTYQNHRFHVTGTVLPERDERTGMMLGMIYLQDQTELLQVRDEYIRSRPMVSIILVDNYDELTNNLSDAAVSGLNAQIDAKINDWADEFGGLLRRIERNRFLLLLEAKDLSGIANGKFSLLESIRSVTNPAGIPATVSIGVGKDGVDFRENHSFAALSIEMALSRGGDQAVVKDRYDFTFFGGRNTQNERRSSTKSRVVASTFSELIQQSSRIFVMGHKMADLDALGAAVGVCCICRKQGKKASIVMDPQVNAAGPLLTILKTMPEYANCFMTGQDALVAADAESLLVVVDTNRPEQVECKPLLESIRRVVVIDHHRRAADYIEHSVMSLHEPFASSASELVTELIQYSLDASDILANEAAALLAGISLDTKNFTIRTTSRSFEAAAFLRHLGADTVMVKKLFQNDLNSTLARYKIIQCARSYRKNIAIAALDYTANRTIAAQAADELLNISGFETSFVLYPQGDQVIVSARSIGKANVQVILEPLGGGGNAATAGAQIKGKTVREVLDGLTKSIDKFMEQ